jgi:hypothetical protein
MAGRISRGSSNDCTLRSPPPLPEFNNQNNIYFNDEVYNNPINNIENAYKMPISTSASSISYCQGNHGRPPHGPPMQQKHEYLEYHNNQHNNHHSNHRSHRGHNHHSHKRSVLGCRWTVIEFFLFCIFIFISTEFATAVKAYPRQRSSRTPITTPFVTKTRTIQGIVVEN